MTKRLSLVALLALLVPAESFCSGSGPKPAASQVCTQPPR
jgi:hypothetical protein